MRTTTPVPYTIRLVVSDPARSRRFYTEVLGLMVIPGEDGWSSTLPDGRRLEAGTAGPRRRFSSQSAFTVELGTPEAVVASHILARITGGAACAPVLQSGRWTATLLDPDGHVVRVSQAARAPGHGESRSARTGRRNRRWPRSSRYVG